MSLHWPLTPLSAGSGGGPELILTTESTFLDVLETVKTTFRYAKLKTFSQDDPRHDDLCEQSSASCSMLFMFPTTVSSPPCKSVPKQTANSYLFLVVMILEAGKPPAHTFSSLEASSDPREGIVFETISENVVLLDVVGLVDKAGWLDVEIN